MEYRQFGGGSSLVTQFSDSFHRANVANLGPNWAYFSQPTALTQLHTTQVSVNGNAWTAQDSSASQTQNNSPENWIPWAIMNTKVSGKQQFAQARFLTNTSGVNHDMRAAIMVACGLNGSGDLQAYYFENESGPQYRLFKYAANAFTDIGGGGFAVPAANDICRINYTPTTGVINCILNGTTVKTVTDGTPIVTGWPGISKIFWISGVGPPATTCTYDNFSCGIGL